MHFKRVFCIIETLSYAFSYMILGFSLVFLRCWHNRFNKRFHCFNIGSLDCLNLIFSSDFCQYRITPPFDEKDFIKCCISSSIH